MKSMKIAVDFDGTCVTHEYPHIGKDIGAVVVLKQLVNMGHKIILNTMRSGLELEAAVNWFKENGIDLYGVNEDPGQKEWTRFNLQRFIIHALSATRRKVLQDIPRYWLRSAVLKLP